MFSDATIHFLIATEWQVMTLFQLDSQRNVTLIFGLSAESLEIFEDIDKARRCVRKEV